jgi:hypothetical protein
VILFVILGCAFALVGLYGLIKFTRQVVRPKDEKHRRARLPFLLMSGRTIGMGVGFIVFGLTHSWLAFGLAVVLSVSEGIWARWTAHRYPDLLDDNARDPAA